MWLIAIVGILLLLSLVGGTSRAKQSKYNQAGNEYVPLNGKKVLLIDREAYLYYGEQPRTRAQPLDILQANGYMVFCEKPFFYEKKETKLCDRLLEIYDREKPQMVLMPAYYVGFNQTTVINALYNHDANMNIIFYKPIDSHYIEGTCGEYTPKELQYVGRPKIEVEWDGTLRLKVEPMN